MAARLDSRLLSAGLTVTMATLVAVFIDHRPGQASTCGACGHRYTTAERLCPSAVVVRSLLRQRRHENSSAVEGIAKELNARDLRVLPEPDPVSADETGTDELFPVDPSWRRTAGGVR